MLTNKDVFTKNPLTNRLPNKGVSKVREPQTTQEWDVLHYELSNFVCEGEYYVGLERVLSSFLANLDEPTQPAFWIAGFYGSGKSHLARVLEFLWRNNTFPDGAKARGLVNLPDDISAHLQELDIKGRRNGGLWSAAGSLGSEAANSIRIAIVSVFCRSAGLPPDYPVARLVLWLKKNGFYDAVRAAIEAEGKDFDDEILDLYASPVVSKAILAANPGYGSEAAVAEMIRAQFPMLPDISDDQMTSTLTDIMRLQADANGKLPLTLVVLDELQQYLYHNPNQTLSFQQAVEACCSVFGSRLLIVATGQNALRAIPELSKLTDRFSRPIQLSDKDVETVIRQVVLQKAPQYVSQVAEILDKCSGEIERQLANTKLGPEATDQPFLVPDYPLLPTRRRFWEHVLRAVDRAGAAGQLRTQLSVVHETLREVADKPLGTVVAADRLYAQISDDLVMQGTLLKDIYHIIESQDDGTPDGILRKRLCATIYMIGRLSKEAGADTGLRATADVLADLLVEDLQVGSTPLRQIIPGLLAKMVEKGTLIPIGSEYGLQTRESAEWEADFRSRLARINADAKKIADDRTAELRTACAGLKSVSFTVGESKTPRKVDLHFAADAPMTDTGNIPIWIRDEWSVTEKTVREEAQAAGTQSPIVFVSLPRRAATEFNAALGEYAALTETLQHKGTPATREGQEARSGMETRQKQQRLTLNDFVADIVKAARVYQGGGNEVVGKDLVDAAGEASKVSAARLYPDFAIGDAGNWERVKTQARDGNPEALKVLGFNDSPDKHPACQRVLVYIGTAGKNGLAVRRHFTGTSYGWPQDAVDGALLVLTAANLLDATKSGNPVTVKQIEQAALGQTEFKAVNVTVTMPQRLEVGKLLLSAGLSGKPADQAVSIPEFVGKMRKLAEDAGGEAPLPVRPATTLLDELKSLAGNDLVFRVYEYRQQLGTDLNQWTALKQTAQQRKGRWDTLLSLQKQAASLPIITSVSADIDAIRTNRSLLSDPDPVPSLCDTLTSALRAAIMEARQHLLDEYSRRMEAVDKDENWKRLTGAEKQNIRQAHGLLPLPELKVGTETELLAALNQTPLPNWATKTDALVAQVSRALLDAAKKLEPMTVQFLMPGRSVKTLPELDAYLADVRAEIAKHLEAGNPVVI